MKKYCIGSRIGAEQVSFGIFEKSGHPVDFWTMDSCKGNGCKKTLSDMSASIQRKLQKIEIDPQELLGVGVSIPGEMNRDGLLNYCVELGWGIVEIKTLMQKMIGLPVRVVNRRDAAVLGEHWTAGRESIHHMVNILLGDKLQGGLIIHDKLIYGDGNITGDLGDMQLLTHTSKGRSEWKRLDQAASYAAIVENYKKQVMDRGAPSMFSDLDDLEIRDIQHAADSGDPLANKLLDEAAVLIAGSIANLGSVVKLDLAVIGGEGTEENKKMSRKIKNQYKKWNRDHRLEVRFTKLGIAAEVYGSAKLLMEEEIRDERIG